MCNLHCLGDKKCFVFYVHVYCLAADGIGKEFFLNMTMKSWKNSFFSYVWANSFLQWHITGFLANSIPMEKCLLLSERKVKINGNLKRGTDSYLQWCVEHHFIEHWTDSNIIVRTSNKLERICDRTQNTLFLASNERTS